MTAADPDVTSPGKSGNILRRTANGAAWIVGWRMARRLLGFVNIVVLARLLTPADFGIVALASGISGTLESFAAVGVEDALVREKAPSRALYDTGFTINILRSALVALVLVAIAVPLSAFLRDQRLTSVIFVFAALLMVTAFSNIGTVDFRRDLAFEREFLLLIIPRILGMAVTVGVALTWHSYWALIAGIATNRLGQLIASYVMHPYRPTFSLRAWRNLAGFSSWTWALSIAMSLRDRSDTFVLGHVLGDVSVGTYAMGSEIPNLTTTEIVGPLSRACFSGFSAAQHAGEDVGRLYLRVIAAVSLLAFPAGVGISAVAAPAVRLLLGPQWSAVVPLVQLLGPVCTTTTFGLMGASLLTSHGMLSVQFRIIVVVALLRLGFLLALIPRFGVMGAAIAASIGVAVEYSSYLVITMHRFRIAPREIAWALWRILAALGVMTLVLMWSGLGWGAIGPHEPVGSLLAAVIVGGVSYAAALIGLWLAVGRPAGAEADVISLFERPLRRLRRLGAA